MPQRFGSGNRAVHIRAEGGRGGLEEKRVVKKDNKGFTLLEVLVAVIILGIVVVPLLRSFVSAYHVNARSREVMRATTLAQNEMEIFEREKLAVLLKYAQPINDAAPGGEEEAEDGTDSEEKDRVERYGGYRYEWWDPADPEHIKYIFQKTGVINDESGRNTFDVYVTIDPEKYSDELPADPDTLSSIESANNEGLLFMNTLSGEDSGSYVQRIRNGYNVSSEDEEVFQIYVRSQHPESESGARYTAMDFAAALNRTITLTIEQVKEGDKTTTMAKVNYTYTLDPTVDNSVYNSVPEEYRTYTEGDKVIFNNASTLDEDGDPVELKNVYLFYAPILYTDDPEGGTSGTAGVRNDKIVVENPDGVPVNVYIIRQNMDNIYTAAPDDIVGAYTDAAGNQQNTLPIGYTVDLEINEKLDGDNGGRTFGRYFTNLNLDPMDPHGSTNVILKDYDDTGRYFSADEAMELTGLRVLGSTEAQDRIYSMTVAVYRHDEDFDGSDPSGRTDEPLVELTGTKIE